ncbi:phosphatidate cytidylyltransferase [Mucilaginibacter arboris]|uniref:Phosphatidate cytidylyltransferase n=1 Tax=Mucilaginibacter arboris TaxID=2682090 RepID=A0A7K1ST00_9SPHI|nr:phosphatidate cytidylyltransferase [Mucilaginibacter arboris]MVN20230.1 phosphatidate cytidylyltransferase [Mucilaginibacter arboris]
MKTRAITGFFFVVVMLVAFFFGPYVFLGFFSLLSLLCLFEFYGLINTTDIYPQQVIGLILGAVICAGTASFWLDASFSRYFSALIILLSVIVFFAELYRKPAKPFHQIAYTFLGLIYTLMPFVFFMAMAFLQGKFSFHLPLGFILLLWTNDTSAYLIGKNFGKNKLFERHSPKKTWEGFIGGIAATALIAFLISRYFQEVSALHWIIVALIISIFGTMSDLVESMLKRSINVKDSGSILPGHGGLLDRFDGLLLAAPLVFIYLYLFSTL